MEKPADLTVQKEAEKAAEETAPEEGAEISFDHCVAVLTECGTKCGIGTAHNVVKSFGVKRITELKPEQYEELVTKLKAEIKKTDKDGK